MNWWLKIFLFTILAISFQVRAQHDSCIWLYFDFWAKFRIVPPCTSHWSQWNYTKRNSAHYYKGFNLYSQLTMSTNCLENFNFICSIWQFWLSFPLFCLLGVSTHCAVTLHFPNNPQCHSIPPTYWTSIASLILLPYKLTHFCTPWLSPGISLHSHSWEFSCNSLCLVINYQGILKEPPQLTCQSENPRCLPYAKQWFLKTQCFSPVSCNDQDNLCLCILLRALKPLSGRIPAWPGSPGVRGVSHRKCDGELSERGCFAPKDIQHSL